MHGNIRPAMRGSTVVRRLAQEVVMTVLKTTAWPWFVLAVALIVVGLVFAKIVLAVGLLALFGAIVRVISRGDTRPPDDRRVPAGHPGV
jgi:hypothetical protein